MNLTKINEQLKEMFDGFSRKIVFWYDDNAEFEGVLEELEIGDVKIHRLTQKAEKKKNSDGEDEIKMRSTNQFHTKWLLERADTTSHYLIYAPFSRPSIIENHLEDTILYSQVFMADRASMLSKELDLGDRELVAKYQNFFGSSERMEKLKQLDYENNLEIAMMSVLCKSKIARFDEVLRNILSQDLEDNTYLQQLEKYQLDDVFWHLCETVFGFSMEIPTLEKLVYSLFLTGTQKIVGNPLPERLHHYLSSKTGSVIAFLDSMLYYKDWEQRFSELSNMVFENLLADSGYFQTSAVENYVSLELYQKVDEFFISYILKKLEIKDFQVTVEGMSLDLLCHYRQKTNFGSKLYKNQYHALKNAFFLLQGEYFTPLYGSVEIYESYLKSDYIFDQNYRQFYYHYDKMTENNQFEGLKEQVEQIYTHKFLNPLSVSWTKALTEEIPHIPLQRDFYKTHVSKSKERVVVIISDALRYEVAQSLLKKLESDEKCNPELSAMLGILPSYTRLGMSALLPHETLEITEEFQVEVDGKECYSLPTRERALIEKNELSVVIPYSEVENSKSKNLREISAGKEVIYIYHDNIDAIGDKRATEKQTFSACETAIEEIHHCIRKMSSANNTKFIITADHGFIYKRDSLEESDKIGDFSKENVNVNRRYLISDESIQTEGVVSFSLGKMLGNNDLRTVTVPMGSDVFKVQGGGQNFVHGGASLQELVIPVLTVKTLKGKQETKVTTISAVNFPKKLTNLTTKIRFIQNEAVSDIYKETTYRLFFKEDNGEVISNEVIYAADSAVTDSSKRLFTTTFNLKNKAYPKEKNYFFIAMDTKNEIEVIHEEVRVDLAFTDDYGF